MTYVFINIENPKRIKMIQALNKVEAYLLLAKRLNNEPNSGLVHDYNFGYYL